MRMPLPVLQIFMTIFLLCASQNAVGGQIGTTPEGNVIYRFSCPSARGQFSPAKLDWHNHAQDQDGLTWDADEGLSGFYSEPNYRVLGISRSGQVISCRYDVTAYGQTRQNTYRYHVNRDVISCKNPSSNAIECMLRPSSGGK